MAAPSAPNPSTAQARVLVDELARGGLTDAVVCPGSRSAALAVALHEDPRVRVHVHPDERSAAFVALGLGRVTGRPAAVLVTSGTAVANLHPAALEADHGGVPLLLLTADRPPELRGTGANQTINQVGLFGGATRWVVDLGVAEERSDAVRTWRSVAARALAESFGLAGPPGPVQVNVPFREPTVPVADDGRTAALPFALDLSGRGAFAPWVTVARGRPTPDPALLDDLAERIATCERGLIVIGGDAGVTASDVDRLAEATGWPVLVEGHATSRRAAATLVTGSALLADPLFVSAYRAEVVLRIGRTTVLPATAAVGAGTHEILVDPWGRWADPGRTVGRLVLADPTALIAGVVERLPVATGSDWLDGWRRADAAASGAIAAAVADGSAPAELACIAAVVGSAPEQRALVIGSSGPVRDLDLVAAGPGLPRIHANRGVSGIDGTISTSLGIALGGAATTAIMGDLTFLHDSGGLLLAADAPAVDLVMVVLVNDGGALFDRLPPARHAPGFERLFVAPHGRRLDLVARAHGIGHVRVGTVGQSLDEVRRRSVGIHLVEVAIDRGDEAVRRDAMTARVRAAIGATIRRQ